MKLIGCSAFGGYIGGETSELEIFHFISEILRISFTPDIVYALKRRTGIAVSFFEMHLD